MGVGHIDERQDGSWIRRGIVSGDDSRACGGDIVKGSKLLGCEPVDEQCGS